MTARSLPFVRLGMLLAGRGPLFFVSLGLSLVIVGWAATRALVLAKAGNANALLAVPAACSSALVWGTAILVAFGASVQALRRDRAEGIVALMASRGALGRYLFARVSGLATLLFVILGGGALVSGLACTFAAMELSVALEALGATGASVAYGAAASVTLALVCFAALGTRSRGGGYVRLAAILFIPELLQQFLVDLVPDAWRELLSIPEALVALRSALTPHAFDPFRLGRAVVLLVFVCGIALVVIKRELASLEAEAGR